MANMFTGKGVKNSDVQFTEAGDGALGYTFHNTGAELMNSLEFIGCSDAGQTPFDTFKAVDPASLKYPMGGI